MIKTYNKQEVLEPLISGYPHIFEELKIKMQIQNAKIIMNKK